MVHTVLAQAVYSGFFGVTQQAVTKMRECFSAVEEQHPEIGYLAGHRLNGMSMILPHLFGVCACIIMLCITPEALINPCTNICWLINTLGVKIDY